MLWPNITEEALKALPNGIRTGKNRILIVYHTEIKIWTSLDWSKRTVLYHVHSPPNPLPPVIMEAKLSSSSVTDFTHGKIATNETPEQSNKTSWMIHTTRLSVRRGSLSVSRSNRSAQSRLRNAETHHRKHVICGAGNERCRCASAFPFFPTLSMAYLPTTARLSPFALWRWWWWFGSNSDAAGIVVVRMPAVSDPTVIVMVLRGVMLAPAEWFYSACLFVINGCDEKSHN